jgi:hypothetical protein
MDWNDAIEDNASRWYKKEGGVDGRRAELQEVVKKHAVVELIDDHGTFDIVGFDTVEEAIELLDRYVRCDPVGIGRISVSGIEVMPMLALTLVPK